MTIKAHDRAQPRAPTAGGARHQSKYADRSGLGVAAKKLIKGDITSSNIWLGCEQRQPSRPPQFLACHALCNPPSTLPLPTTHNSQPTT